MLNAGFAHLRRLARTTGLSRTDVDLLELVLRYLAPAQVEEAFRAYFALPPPAGLTDLAALTPGDFAVVHRKAGFLGKHGEPEALTDMLRAECDAKPDRPRPIGLRP